MSTELPNTEDQNISIENLRGYITLSSVLEIKPEGETFPPNEGKGVTNTGRTYDLDKIQNIRNCGVEVTDDIAKDPAKIVTMSIMLDNIGAILDVRNDNGNVDLAFQVILNKLINHRIDFEGVRNIVDFSNHKTVADYLSARGASSNPQARVSPYEFLKIYKYIHDTFSKKELTAPTL